MADSQEERAHWRDILRAFDGYMQYHVSKEGWAVEVSAQPLLKTTAVLS